MLSLQEVCFQLDGMYLGPFSLELSAGERLVVLGETGSGKSTLLKGIAGLRDAASGTIAFLGKKVTGPLYNLVPGHPGIAYLSQHFELRNNYVVADYLDYGNKLSAAETTELFDACHISHLLRRKTNSGLSGGEKQRIALAKLLLQDPRLLLLDEPFSNMDEPTRGQLLQILSGLEQTHQLTIMMVLHDAREALSWAQRIWVLQQGQLVADGLPQQLYHQPESDYVAGLLGSYQWVPQALCTALGAGGLERPSGPRGKLMRPADWEMLPADAAEGLPGRMLQQSFTGACWMLRVLVGETTLELMHLGKPPEPGETIRVKARL